MSSLGLMGGVALPHALGIKLTLNPLDEQLSIHLELGFLSSLPDFAFSNLNLLIGEALGHYCNQKPEGSSPHITVMP